MGIGAVILEPAMIAAQLLFEPRHRLIGGKIGIGRLALRMQRDLRIEMNGAFGAEPKTIPFERNVSGIAAIEIFAQRFGDPLPDAPAQSFAEIEVLSGYAKRHGSL